MSEDFDVSDGDDNEFGSPIATGGEPRIVDPDSIGVDHTARGNSRDSGNSGGGDSAGDTGSGDYGDGWGESGQFGRGRFPDGRSRKRYARGTNPGTERVASSAGGKKSKARPLNPHALEVLLISLHAGLSAILEQGVPDNERIVRLGENDAKRLAQATADVARWYPVLATTEKVMDHINLVTVAATIYGPMAMVMGMRRAERKAEAARQRANVRNISERTVGGFQY